MSESSKLKATVFYCINSSGEAELVPLADMAGIELKFVKMACSSMVKDVFLLRAFEAGADAVVVVACPEGACRYVEGNLRAKKRVKYVQALLDEIGLGGERLSLYNVAAGDAAGVEKIVEELRVKMTDLGPNPAG